ncbi:MAG: hypothetical protein CMK83_24965 [Pseudomonadales bacterium]|jgi:uncharacterized protein|uniref:tetratricopeptide repeat protein n=1 Tax=unclassified Ketobacter TaxID=2639109 RepID=UPI000C49920B|nr:MULTISPECIES: hypothetical protein [unclassified Ketobacter]MAQ24408.1 hypothetical protein [Pseudomonadales bacterium]MEC8810754.1 hypothetical protein [Pseudomonadota bacterium]TNC90716.1 MAG: hypothetical protein CSH49_01700 [Alcanivorax sp.]HAG96850.1 hypothetical protein [Gammaproteobacteria bacterium]MAQ27472.1 hypothetical protein [Pseudomonadales bacterium]|tara:strand:- start:275 stop:724 length:450 start_codon:yes stop_codon:yes gene_type:complete
MIADSINNECGVMARFSFRAANRIIDIQCQRGRAYPSRFSLKMLQYSADHGHRSAMSQLGSLLYNCGVGRAVKRSGLEYIRMAAKAGDAEAQYQLGKAYYDGGLTHQDNKAATHWLALAVDRGHEQAAEVLQQCQTALNDETEEHPTLA